MDKKVHQKVVSIKRMPKRVLRYQTLKRPSYLKLRLTQVTYFKRFVMYVFIMIYVFWPITCDSVCVYLAYVYWVPCSKNCMEPAHYILPFSITDISTSPQAKNILAFIQPSHLITHFSLGKDGYFSFSNFSSYLLTFRLLLNFN